MDNPNVVASCKKNIQVYSANCSGLVKAVAKDFNIEFSGQANDIFMNLLTRPGVNRYGVGWNAARSAGSDALHGLYLVIAASYAPGKGDHGHVAIVTGLSPSGEVIVYGGVLNHPEKASKGIRIQSKSWAAFKLTYPYVAAQPPAFFGVPIPIPLIA
jgi:hypothetical protein